MPSHLFELKNLELKGQLKDYLRKARKENLSYRTIATKLSESGTSVGRTAVMEWCEELRITKQRSK